MVMTEHPDAYWPKAACPNCELGGIRSAPVDMTCCDCGGRMTLMPKRVEVSEG